MDSSILSISESGDQRTPDYLSPTLWVKGIWKARTRLSDILGLKRFSSSAVMRLNLIADWGVCTIPVF